MKDKTCEGNEIPVYSEKVHDSSKIFKQDCYLTYVRYQLHLEW